MRQPAHDGCISCLAPLSVPRAGSWATTPPPRPIWRTPIFADCRRTARGEAVDLVLDHVEIDALQCRHGAETLADTPGGIDDRHGPPLTASRRVAAPLSNKNVRTAQPERPSHKRHCAGWVY